MRKLQQAVAAAICFCLLALCLAACAGQTVDVSSSQIPAPPESPAASDSENPSQPEGAGFLTLSETGAKLYDATYATMTGRLGPDGYAATSLTGAYDGMFVRDSSIQIMAHIVNGDMDAAASMLRFIVGTHVALGADKCIHIMYPTYSYGSVDFRGETEGEPRASDLAYAAKSGLSATLDTSLNGKVIKSVKLWLAADRASDSDTVTLTLKSGKKTVSSAELPLSKLGTKDEPTEFVLPLPLFKLNADDGYTVELTPSRKGSVTWYGRDGDHLSYRADHTRVFPNSTKIQVDGHYMFVNAFALFALNDDGSHGQFVEDVYPMLKSYALRFVEDKEYMHSNGLLRNPNYEHSRQGRYWDCYDLITNCFASQALHNMAAVARGMGKADDAKKFEDYAGTIADGVHKNLTCEIGGKRIYAELIALDEDGKLYKGFSFVNLAPVACDWYAVDAGIMAATYEEYLRLGGEYYGKYRMLSVVTELSPADLPVSNGGHVIGKGLAWELMYLYRTGNTERLSQLLDFIDERSKETYPEVWVKDGSFTDNANQEHANWLIYEIARITGRGKITQAD